MLKLQAIRAVVFCGAGAKLAAEEDERCTVACFAP